MTDLGAVAPPQDTGNALEAALNFAPDLRSQPGLAVGVASAGGDVGGNAQAAAHASNQVALGAAVNDVAAKVTGGHKGLFDRIVGDTVGVGSALLAVGTFGASVPVEAGIRAAFGGGQAVSQGQSALHVAGAAAGAGVGGTLGLSNKPLQQVQHEYRYLRDIEARHGPAAVVPAALALGVGTVAGGRFGGSQGAVLGGEAALYAVGHVLYTDSWDRTGAANYVDPNTGQPVSPGRDVANLVRGEPKPGTKDWLSGAIDGTFDLFADPVAKSLAFKAHTLTADGAGGWLGHRIGGIGLTDPTTGMINVDRAAQRPAVAAAVQWITDQSDPSAIRERFPLLSPLADRLAAADSFDATKQVFKDTIGVYDLQTNVMPTQTITQGILRNARSYVAGHLGDVGGFNSTFRLPSLQAVALDPQTLEWSGKTFDVADNFGAQGVWRMARYSLSRQAADDIYDAYINTPVTDIGARKLILRNLNMQVALAAGAPPGGTFVQGLQHELDQVSGGLEPAGHAGSYGYDMAGNDLSRIQRPDAPGTTQAALTEEQTSTKATFMNYHELRQAARGTSAWAQLMGGLDDMIYSHWTSTVFKPLALASAGFGFRVAMAEAIPNALRLGTVRSGIATAVNALTKLGYEVPEEEAPHVDSAVINAVRRVAPNSDFSKLARRSAELVTTEGGSTIVPAIESGNTFSLEPVQSEGMLNRLNKALLDNPHVVEKDEFGSFGPGAGSMAKTHEELWQTQLAHIAHDPGTQLVADIYQRAVDNGASTERAAELAAAAHAQWWNLDADPVYKARFMRATAPTVAGQDPAVSLSEARTKLVQGLTHTPELPTSRPVVDEDTLQFHLEPTVSGGTPNMSLLRQVADGKVPSLDELHDIPVADRPSLIPGRIAMSVPGGGNLINRVASGTIRKLAEPIINVLSREPTFLLEYSNQMDTLQPLVDNGTLNAADAMQVAKVRAVVHMTPFVHNTLERSMFSELARNVLPFYFAQEQAYKRFGRLLADNPAAFRQYQLMLTGMVNVGQPSVDGSGGQFLTLPGTGYLGTGVPALLAKLGIATTFGSPVGFSGNLKSLSSVFPFTEDVNPLSKMGPVAVIPMKAVADLFPKTEPAVASIIGSQADQSTMWGAVIPNSALLSTVTALDPSIQAHTMVSTTLQIVQDMAYRQDAAMAAWVKAGHDPAAPGHPQIVPDQVMATDYATNPAPWDQFVDRVRNQVRITFLLKAAVGVLSPLAPSINAGNLQLKGELHALTTKYGLAEGRFRFLSAHPDATPYTVGLSAGPKGVDVPPTKAFMAFVDAHQSLFNTYGPAAYWVAPQDSGRYDPAIYTEQLRVDLRHLKSAQTFIADLFTADGNKVFYDEALPAYEQARATILGMGSQYQAALTAQQAGNTQPMALYRAKEAIAARGASAALRPLSDAFNTQLANFGKTHLTWYANFLDATGAAKVKQQATIDGFRKMFADGTAPATPEAVGVRVLLAGLDTYLAEIDPTRYPGSRVPTLIKEQSNLAWQQYLLDTSASHPELSGVINAVFRSYQG